MKRVLVVAGLDPSGGAGLAADLEALAAVGARGLPVAAALTAQGPKGARLFQTVRQWLVLEQIDALLDGAAGDRIPRAVKTGMLGSAAVARALGERLRRADLARAPLIVDPTLAASSGLSLLRAREPAAALRALFDRALVVTPNLPELAALTGMPVDAEEAMVAAARSLPCRAVLVKGGHRAGAPVDLLVEGRRVTRFVGRRLPGTARGTGCRLASAMAGLLAQGRSLNEAVRGAKRLVERYIAATAKAGASG